MTHAPPEPAPDSAAVLDADALAGLAALDPGGANKLVSRVLATYHVSLARLLQQIDEASIREDLAAVRLAAHTLKSSSASIGALALSGLCGAAEQAIREGRTEAVPSIVDQLRAEARRVELAVRKLMSA